MKETLPPERVHKVFTGWAKAQGVEINGIQASRIVGRGLGLVTVRNVEKGEKVVNVPLSAVLTVDSISKTFRALHDKHISVHGLLASFLAFGEGEVAWDIEPWRATWPTYEDLKECMPLLWPSAVKERRKDSFCAFPPFARDPQVEDDGSVLSAGLLQQKEKLMHDWNSVRKVIKNAKLLKYIHYWLIVNTRSFFFETPGGLKPPCRDSRMALCPFIDYFNHADHGCNVTFDEKGYTVTSDQSYGKFSGSLQMSRYYEASLTDCLGVGEELYVSYGNHSNDFLLTEYGFILEENKWDSLPLDDFLLPKLAQSARDRLERAGYLGDYTLSKEGICYRTHVAIRTQTLSDKDWRKYVEGKEFEMSEVRDGAKADAYLVDHILSPYRLVAEATLAGLEKIEQEKAAGPRNILIQRWTQIRNLIQRTWDKCHAQDVEIM